jgi:hypothetical protein
LPLAPAGGKQRQVRHIEERKYVPPLAAPSQRPALARSAEPPLRGAEGSVRARAPLGRGARMVIVVGLVVAAAVVAALFFR